MRTISAQIFIKTKTEFIKEVFNKLKEIPNIKDIHLSSNIYNIIAKHARAIKIQSTLISKQAHF